MKKAVFLTIFLLNICCIMRVFAAENKDVEEINHKFSQLSIGKQKVVTRSILEDKEAFILIIMQKDYDRDLVTRFIEACPSQKNLATATCLSTSTISKLKNPETYGILEPSAKQLWLWVRSKNMLALTKELQLTSQNIKAMANALSLINLSNRNIVYDKLGKSMCSGSGFITQEGLCVVKDVIKYLCRMKGTFTKVNLSGNHLSDEGLIVLVDELKQHEDLEEVHVRNNKISDEGLKYLKNLFLLPHLRLLDFSQNYGPSTETLSDMCLGAPEGIKEKIKY